MDPIKEGSNQVKQGCTKEIFTTIKAVQAEIKEPPMRVICLRSLSL